MADQPTRLEQAVAAAEDLTRLTREAHGLLQEAKRITGDLEAATAAAATAAETAARTAIEEVVQTEVDKQLAELGESTRKAMDEAVDKVLVEFGRLSSQLVYGNSQGRGVSIADLARRAGRTKRG